MDQDVIYKNWSSSISTFLKDGASVRAFLLTNSNFDNKKILKGVLVEFLVSQMTYQSNVLWIGDDDKVNIEKVRSIYSFLSKTSYNALPRVVVIESVEELNISSSNALLKILEDSAVDVYFFLLCSNASKILSTIKSRCVRISLPRSLDENDNFDPDFSSEFESVVLNFNTDIRCLYKFLDSYFSKDNKEVRWSNFDFCVRSFCEKMLVSEGKISNRVISNIKSIYSILDNAEKYSLSLYNSALLIFQKLSKK